MTSKFKKAILITLPISFVVWLLNFEILILPGIAISEMLHGEGFSLDILTISVYNSLAFSFIIVTGSMTATGGSFGHFTNRVTLRKEREQKQQTKS